MDALHPLLYRFPVDQLVDDLQLFQGLAVLDKGVATGLG
jgi:hypothetical protein